MMTAVMIAATLQLVSLFPAGTKIIETHTVRKARVIVLWMMSPTREPTPCPRLEDWGESCPDRTQGCYFHGPTRVSLVDTTVPRIMNTIAIDDPDSGEDAFDIPFKVLTPGPYRFDHRKRRPTILSLRDYNGDGKALEFALFQALTCSDLLTALFGYSERRDALIQYSVRVQYDGPGKKTEDFVTDWPEHLFNTKPVRPRFWRYVLVYPPGPPDVPWEHWTVRYLPSREEFEAHCVATMQR